MFTARKRLKGNRLYSREFLVSFSEDLKRAGFTEIYIKLPHNIVGTENNKISLDDFLNKERNFPSLIFESINPTNNEEIKILFVNISAKAFFVDDIFPSGHSEPQEIFVRSNDPARVYSLINFFKSYIENESIKSPTIFISIIYIISLIFIISQIFSLFAQFKFILNYKYQLPVWLDVSLLLVSLFVMYKMILIPKGLYITKRPDRGVVRYINMALKGQLVDNPMVSLIISILGSLIVAIIFKLIDLF
jgi:hypothetical protein